MGEIWSKLYICLHVKYPLLLNFLTRFSRSTQISNFHTNSSREKLPRGWVDIWHDDCSNLVLRTLLNRDRKKKRSRFSKLHSFFCKVHRRRPFCPSRTATCRWTRAWNIGGITLTEEKEVLGEKPVTLSLCHHTSHTHWPEFDVRPTRKQAGDKRPKPRHELWRPKLTWILFKDPVRTAL